MHRFDKNAKFAFAVACIVLLACNAGFQWGVSHLNAYLKKEPVPLRGTFDTISRSIGQWEAIGKDAVFDDATIEQLGTDKCLDRNYAIEGDPRLGRLQVHLAYYTGMIDPVPHVPDRCFEAGGLNKKTQPANLPLQVDRGQWLADPQFKNLTTGEPYEIVRFKHEFTGQKVDVRMPLGDLILRTTEFEQPSRRNSRIYGGYFFIANGRATPTPEGVRAMAFELSEKHAYYCKVQFTYEGTEPGPARYLELVSDFLKDFLPELMQRLPDWAEVERRGESMSVASN